MFKEIISDYRLYSDPTKAGAMAKYMKNQFAFLGIPGPIRGQLQKPFLREVKLLPVNWEFVQECWELPEREYQYLAIEYLIAVQKKLIPDDMIHIENILATKSWWDSVDSIAINLLGPLCSRHRDVIDRFVLPWSQGDNLWLARSAILYQLKYKSRTDRELLGQIVAANCKSREFFINKAIGWALREYSKTDPEWVRKYLQTTTLSSLSVREASKYL